MRTPQTYASGWLGYWSYLGGLATQQSYRAMRDVERRRYSTDKFFSDLVSFWSGAACGWWSAALGWDRRVPTIYFEFGDQTQTAVRCVPIFAPSLPYGKPRVAFLRPIVHGNANEINETKCRTRIISGGLELEVALIDLLQPQQPSPRGAASPLPPHLTSGIYQGEIVLGGELVAHLYVEVLPSPPPPQQITQP